MCLHRGLFPPYPADLSLSRNERSRWPKRMDNARFFVPIGDRERSKSPTFQGLKGCLYVLLSSPGRENKSEMESVPPTLKILCPKHGLD